METNQLLFPDSPHFTEKDEDSPLVIVADHRERLSGIPEWLLQKDVKVYLTALATGDYPINKSTIVGRKSAEDFIHSLLSNRLFNQCACLSQSAYHPFSLLEGDPCDTLIK